MREINTDASSPPCDAIMAGVAPDQGGDAAEAFRRLFESVYDDLVRFTERRAAAAAVDDVVAETFLVAWRRWHELPADPADVRPWLFAVARHTLANSHRGRRRSRAVAVRIAAQPDQPAEDDATAVAQRVDLERAFRRLSSRDQEALALVAWDGLTPAEAARTLEISDSAFSVRLSRARRRLRQHLDSGPAEGASR
ncbi:RNA polymerase sigma factor [Bogoriella caseilytica]|uniref:RNA polymerase sigma-70 factor (ECF subfamily) n=1 Tax=Bogoriella caseilytica TaxID=56055 RepID=A0A3N2BC71_9MICO|nr:sigma-70 family RNA polymerase sigma factor [Bogoriella caseilytica]ROR72859.1 RNA polymerase sigma-70 factor (ECF subfamily) [Bogoriella caseilytica]